MCEDYTLVMGDWNAIVEGKELKTCLKDMMDWIRI